MKTNGIFGCKKLWPRIFAVVLLLALSFYTGCKSVDKTTPLSGRGEGPRGQILPPSSLPSMDEELWVIARRSEDSPETAKTAPESGAMLAKLPEQNTEVPLPLKHTDVKASISAYIATVEVTQQFHNPYDGKIEAVYVFPLPHNAAVNGFIMTIGERRIRGIIRERQQAERIYQEAKSQGYVASLLTQERPNIFTQSVANIEPGKQIDVNIKYFHTLAYADGWYEFVFPMVVGPRFNPPSLATGVGAVARGRNGASGQPTEIEYLKPDERSGHDIALRVEVDAGVAIEEMVCHTHVVSKEAPSPERLIVSLSANDRIPNKDFVLRYRVAGKRIKANLLTSKDERGGFYTLMLYPPLDLNALKRQPMEMVFVLDCSGSMSGRPIEQAKAAVSRALRHLVPDDTFQIIRFSNEASQLGPKPLAATPENVRHGLRYLESLNGEGGTMLLTGIKAALDFPHDPQRLRVVSFLTDGYIGNEAEILAEVHKRLGAARIFSFGVGPAVNHYLLDHMAKLGQGAVAYLSLNDNPVEVMDQYFERISHPALTNIKVEWGEMKVYETFPSRVPDLFVGRPVVLTGRFQGKGSDVLRIAGQAGEQTVAFQFGVKLDSAKATANGLPSVWARMKIADLADRSLYEPDHELPAQIKQLALDYGLMSAYTAFIAVDSSAKTKGEIGTTVPVAVPVPEGVRYKTTVPE